MLGKCSLENYQQSICNFFKVLVLIKLQLLQYNKDECVCMQSPLSYMTLCDPLVCSPPASSVHGVSQARILEWVAMPSSRGSSQPRDWTYVSCFSCIAGRFFTAESLGKTNRTKNKQPNNSIKKLAEDLNTRLQRRNTEDQEAHEKMLNIANY